MSQVSNSGLFDPNRKRTAVRFYFGILVLWALYLLVGPGHPFDEAEHAHVAWLMSKGQVPIRDFFQHHQRVLWDMLRPWFAFGGDGPEVMYLGRAYVLLAGAITVGVLTSLTRFFAPPDAQRWLFPIGAFGVLLIAFASFTFQEVFVCRPEVISTGLALAALWLWACKPGLLPTFVAGALFGIAVFASPRYLSFGLAFALFHNESTIFILPWKRYFAMALGGVSAVALYVWSVDLPIADVLFNLRFSALLQHIGGGNLRAGIRPALFVCALLAVTVVLYRGLRPEFRRRGLVLCCVGAMIAISSLATGARYPYMQNFLVPIVWMALVWSWAETRLDLTSDRTRNRLTAALYIGLLVSCWFSLQGFKVDGALMSQVHFRRQILSSLGPQDRVLLSALRHPIGVRDASYYANPLTDSPDRLCLAVAAAHEPRLPSCDYLRDFMSKRPILVDKLFFYNVLPIEDQYAIKPYLKEHYWVTRQGLFILKR